MKVAVRLFLSLTLFLNPHRLFAKELTLRAGELLICTLQEPNFSSATAEVGEPTVCYLYQLREFGHAASRAAVTCLAASPISAIRDASSAKAG